MIWKPIKDLKKGDKFKFTYSAVIFVLYAVKKDKVQYNNLITNYPNKPHYSCSHETKVYPL